MEVDSPYMASPVLPVFTLGPSAGAPQQRAKQPRRRRNAGPRFALEVHSRRAVIWGMIDVNPAKRGVDNRSPRRREQRLFESWAELDAVAANLAPRYRPMVIFAAATGLRPAEWLALERRDVDPRRSRPPQRAQAARLRRLPSPHRAGIEVAGRAPADSQFRCVRLPRLARLPLGRPRGTSPDLRYHGISTMADDARIVTEDEAARLQRNLMSLLVRSC